MLRKKVILAAVAVAGATMLGAVPAAAMVWPNQVQPIQPGVTGAWTHFWLHLPGMKQSGTIAANGALLSGNGTIEWIDGQDLSVNIEGCVFTVTLVHGSYLIYASVQASNACPGLHGSGDWKAVGILVTAQGPLVLPQPHPVQTNTTQPPVPE